MDSLTIEAATARTYLVSTWVCTYSASDATD
jgi:hypothetical protein